MTFPFTSDFLISIPNRNHQAYIKQKLNDEINQDKSRKTADVFVVISSILFLF